MTAPLWVRWWLAGAALAVVLLGLAVRTSLVVPVGVVALALLALRSPERAAFGGGAIVVSGATYLYSVRRAVERCAEIDRSPSGSCEIFGIEEQLIAIGLYLAVGIGLTAYALVRPRLARVSPLAR